MTATRYLTAKKVVLYCRPECGASYEVPGTTSVRTARNVARRDGWACPTHDRRTAPDRCPNCPTDGNGETKRVAA